MKNIVVAGIGTGVGKTLVAAVLAEALEADYWKPVQAGNLDNTDSDFVKNYISNKQSFFHPETYRLTKPLSPHAAAKIDGVEIELNKILLPQTNNRLIIELAGGLMVPLNKKQLNIDLLQQWNLPVILVSKNYLGSINHTLLSVEILRSCEIQLTGILFNGEGNEGTEKFIIDYTGVKRIGKINLQRKVTKRMVRRYANELIEKLTELLP